ncbi:peptidylprolyl isomerase [Gloeocapsa sp. PCC 73106]|uniref:peptidylprolyl isomerase n=1 Tax=Gloeocapsa sp. PCC 73106 TaxID=102232 RepID=UPI0002AC6C42|nr:peptidylprolyl isomerase [Gloeocapsa sp. PCC 73106]ELR97827.1 peptidyl-prolyl cis-trans isomerase (rotamase) - cyclophilin family [Gloeocapsa sp. PCC 73106]
MKLVVKLGKAIAIALCIIIFSVSVKAEATPVQISMLAQGDAITDPNSLLRYSLPIENQQVRRLQKDIEELSQYLRSKRWGPIQSNLKDAYSVTTYGRQALLSSVPTEIQPQAEAIAQTITEQITELQALAGTKDKEKVWEKRGETLNQITELQDLMVQGFPFEVPEEYSNLPQLKGRATVVLETTQGLMTVVVDGYSAPVNAGNFVDLVQRGFYNGLNFMRNQSDFVVQFGKPEKEDGFIDPKTKEYRAIPLEYLIKGDPLPTYGLTIEDAGIYLADLALPFSAYGTLALARPENDPNGGSSQVFFFKFDNEITPPGFNLMDGRYSVFGYLVEGKEILGNLTPEDKIISAKVVQGLENLVQPT